MHSVGIQTAQCQWQRTTHTGPMYRFVLGPMAGAGRRTHSSCWPGCSTSILPSPPSECLCLCCQHTGSLQATLYPYIQTSWMQVDRTSDKCHVHRDGPVLACQPKKMRWFGWHWDVFDLKTFLDGLIPDLNSVYRCDVCVSPVRPPHRRVH